MESILEAAEASLRHHGGPALRLSELLQLVRARTRRTALQANALREALEAEPRRFRILDPWRGPWRSVGPAASRGTPCDPWVLVVSDPASDPLADPGTGAVGRMGESVRRVGLGIDPLSPRDLARWHALALAERQARGALAKAA